MNMMSNAAETIEKLAHVLERKYILSDLEKCKTLEDYKAVTQKFLTEAGANVNESP